jgi:aminopeptidase-like protein
MEVAEHHIEGASEETVVLIAHLDHTGMANDDLAGVSVGCELIRRLRERDSLRYSYKFLIVQEMTGSAAYLATHESEAENFKYGIFLEMPGNDNRLLLQQSFTGDTRLDEIAEHCLHQTSDDGEVASFREVVGNDELIFEGPGFEIPTISISRAPYEQYHTNLDDPSILTEERLEEYCGLVESIINIFETDFTPVRTFRGVPSLAHPKYDLYLDPSQPALQTESDYEDIEGELSEFRDRLLRLLDGNYTVFDLACRFNLEYEWVRDYLRQFEKKELIRIESPDY